MTESYWQTLNDKHPFFAPMIRHDGCKCLLIDLLHEASQWQTLIQWNRIIATATVEPEVPQTLLPSPFLDETPPTTGPEKSQPKKDPAENSRSRQKPAGAGRSHQKPAKTSSSCHSGSRKNLAARVRTELPKQQFTT